MQNDLKLTFFLRHVLILSSLLISLIGLYFIVSGTETERLIGTCLAIPFTSFYFKTGKIKLKPVYWMNDLHLLFWLILAVLVFHKGIIFWSTPVAMVCLFFLVILKRKENFIQNKP
jgi:hypothetical protein